MQLPIFSEQDTCSINALLKQSTLDDICAALRAQLRDTPEQMHLRWRLFQILCLQGSWQSALKQLQTCAAFDYVSTQTAQAYRCLIQAEQHRTAILAGHRQPQWYQQCCPAWAADLTEALEAAARGDIADADMIRQDAMKRIPDIAGASHAGSFNWITDSDSRLGPVVELLIAGELCLVSFDQICHMQWQAPRGLLDLIWTPVIVTFSDGYTTESYMPGRYPLTHECSDQIKMGRATHWTQVGETTVIGAGQKVWMTDAGDLNIGDIRYLRMKSTTEETDDETS